MPQETLTQAEEIDDPTTTTEVPVTDIPEDLWNTTVITEAVLTAPFIRSSSSSSSVETCNCELYGEYNNKQTML